MELGLIEGCVGEEGHFLGGKKFLLKGLKGLKELGKEGSLKEPFGKRFWDGKGVNFGTG